MNESRRTGRDGCCWFLHLLNRSRAAKSARSHPAQARRDGVRTAIAVDWPATSRGPCNSDAFDDPRHGPARVGLIGTEGAGADRRLELPAEVIVVLGHALEERPDRAGGVHACAFGGGRGLAVATAEAHCAGELLGDQLHLLAAALRALGVVELLRLPALLANLLHALAVGGLPLLVEHRARAHVRGLRLEPGLGSHRAAGAGLQGDAS